MSAPLTGGCLCGAIRYSISAPITELRSCHCRDCQRASGAGGTVGTAVPKSAFKLTQGTPRRFSKTADSGRPWDYIDPASKQHPGQPDAPAAAK